MRSLFLLLHLTASYFCLAQNSWEPTWGPNSGQIYAVHAAGSRLFMASLDGCYRSADGYNWQRMNMPGQSYYYNSNYYSFNVCGNRLYALGFGNLAYSDNWGGSWSQDTLANARLSYINGSEIYLGNYRQLYRSANAGQTWQNITGTLTSVTSTLTMVQEYILGITVFQGNLLVALSNGLIYTSGNNGASWSQLQNLPPPYVYGSYYDKNCLVNDNDIHLYYNNSASLYRATAINAAWQNITPASAGRLRQLRIFNSKLYLAGNSSLFTSGNGNISWQTIGSFTGPCDMVDDGRLTVASARGLHRSVNNGATWQMLYKGIDPLGGGMLMANGPELWCDSRKTADNGGTWENPLCDSLNVLACQGDSMVAAVAAGTANATAQHLYASPDKGATWNRIYFQYPSGMAFSGPKLFAWNSGGLYCSGDLGNNWQLRDTLVCRFFLSAGNAIFVVKQSGGLYKSYDQGLTFTSCNNGLPLTAPGWLTWNGTDLFVLNINTPSYWTPDQGATWKQLPEAGLNISMRENLAASKDKVFICGYNYGERGGAVYKGIYELNAGDSAWHLLNNDTITSSTNMKVVDNYLFAFVGWNGVMRLKIAPDPVGLPENIPAALQCIPNPASTQVHIQCPYNGTALLKVYDCNGACVHQEEVADARAARLSTAALSEGIYFITLSFADKSLNGKLLVAR
jgi:photosystem II stability/assembly factor-like uncharacterized protein